MKNAPGKAYRKGITLKQILRMFPNNEIAEQWLTEQRWPNGVCCPACGSVNVQTGCQHKTMPYRCREKECVKKFSVKTGTVMEGSKVGYQDWLLGAFLLMTSLKSVSSMKLHRDLGITQKSAWFLAQRLRVALSQDGTLFSGPVEVDETYFGGRRRNMSNTKRRGTGGYRPRAGWENGGGRRQRPCDQARRGDGGHGHGRGHAARIRPGSIPRQARRSTPTMLPPTSRCRSITPRSSTRCPSTSKATFTPTGLSRCGAMLKRAHKGTFHKLSPKHLDRYVQEFAGKHNLREHDTIDQLTALSGGMNGKRLRYRTLIAENGLASGARS